MASPAAVFKRRRGERPVRSGRPQLRPSTYTMLMICPRDGLADVLQILPAVHAILADHCLVCSVGDHGSGWIDEDAVYQSTENFERLCRPMAREVQEVGLQGRVDRPPGGGAIVV
jgi:hypothetical protein